MITGNFKTYELTILNGATGELDLSTVFSTEALIKVNPGAANVRMLITPSISSVNADVSDFLLNNGEISEFEVGPGLDRLSFWNASGGQVKVSIAVMF
jgi:hypothetical protein